MQADTETPTPTATATATETATPTATFTPTPDLVIEVTSEAGDAAQIVRVVSVADYWLILLLFAVLVSMWLMFAISRLSGKGR